MSLIPISRVTGIGQPRLNHLLKGRARAGAGERIGVSSMALQAFIDGRATPEMGERLGVGRIVAQELREILGPAGAIGLILGLSIRPDQSKSL